MMWGAQQNRDMHSVSDLNSGNGNNGAGLAQSVGHNTPSPAMVVPTITGGRIATASFRRARRCSTPSAGPAMISASWTPIIPQLCGCCHEGSLRPSGGRNHYPVPRGLISRVGSGRADRREQWLQYAAIQCGSNLPSPMTSRMDEGLWCQPLCERRPNERFCK
jgi:hypothetical protein